MAVCQTALALPRVGMESIYTPALVFAEKKREGRKERKCIAFMKSLRIEFYTCPNFMTAPHNNVEFFLPMYSWMYSTGLSLVYRGATPFRQLPIVL